MADETRIENGTTRSVTAELATAGGGDAAVIADLAFDAAKPEELEAGKLYTAIVPAGSRLAELDTERLEDTPRRARGRVKVSTVESLVDYTKLFYAEESTTVWVEQDTGAVRVVFYDHDPESPGWGDHRAELQLITTDEWLFWTRQDGNLMEQQAFAEHIEDGVKEIVNPDAATMLEVAQSIEATNNAQFRSRVRLDSGEVGFAYDEKIEAQAGQAGEIEVPREFELAIAPFVGEETYKVNSRLRYRIQSGSLRIGYRLERPADVVRDCLDRIAGRLKEEFDRVYIGTPRSG